MRRMARYERERYAGMVVPNGEKGEENFFIKQNSFTNPAQSPMIKIKNTRVMEKGEML